MYNNLLEKIKEYNKITIYRHLRPDGDATFSSAALKQFILDNFDKEVKLCGFESYDKLNTLEEVSDDFITDSLAIILDVSDKARIDDSRFLLAKYRIVIDHHPYVLKEADITINDSSAAAACELLASILYSDTFKDYKKSKEVCKYLYCGILTDSVGFSTSSTSFNTLSIASKLIEDGDFNVSDLNTYLFNVSLDDYKSLTKLRNKLLIEDSIGYCLLDQKDLEEIGMSYDGAKNHVNEFSKIAELKIWAIFAKNPKSGLFDGSIRSRRPYIINKVCERYNGGGHDNACGVKSLDKKTIDKLLLELAELSK